MAKLHACGRQQARLTNSSNGSNATTVSDRQDLMAMAALQLLSEPMSNATSDAAPAAPAIPQDVFDGLEEVRSLLAQAGIAPEGTGTAPPDPMESFLPYILGALAGLVFGGGIAYAILNGMLKGKAASIIKEAEQKGENIKEKKFLQAKEKFLKPRKSTAKK